MVSSNSINAEQCRFNPDPVSHNNKENGGDAIITTTIITPLQVPPVGIQETSSLVIPQR